MYDMIMQRRFHLYNFNMFCSGYDNFFVSKDALGRTEFDPFRKSPNSAEQLIRMNSGFGHFFEKKNDFLKYFLKSYSMYDMIMQRRFHLYNFNFFLLRL